MLRSRRRANEEGALIWNWNKMIADRAQKMNIWMNHDVNSKLQMMVLVAAVDSNTFAKIRTSLTEAI
jgi:hypothetical protein